VAGPAQVSSNADGDRHLDRPGQAGAGSLFNRNSLSRLWHAQMRLHSASTLANPRKENCRNPLASLIWPKIGSTMAFRLRKMALFSGT